ncbi:unnamed protein product [Spirodela intermedia]|uniref:Uncharacterized protein n=1 Tax=Spirodela intermedia TaxID=51605 RepID=A0A7I8JN99_SPIIN|nr:unnamed protein product [Spirodela intermedia]CAA6670942.1 unnamed protein product [Spirodela intermedia]
MVSHGHVSAPRGRSIYTAPSPCGGRKPPGTPEAEAWRSQVTFVLVLVLRRRRAATPGRTCLCAPTTHRGSFRCGLHRGWRRAPSRGAAAAPGRGVDEELLMQIVIRPSRQDLCRRKNFQPKPTRFSTSVAGERSLAVV